MLFTTAVTDGVVGAGTVSFRISVRFRVRDRRRRWSRHGLLVRVNFRFSVGLLIMTCSDRQRIRKLRDNIERAQMWMQRADEERSS